MTRFITAYGKKRPVDLGDFGEGLTKQSFKDECDINNIVASFARDGLADFVQAREPQYADVTGADFQEAMNTVISARAMFDELPSKLRDRFENDPQQFLDFVQDPESRQEAIELGLVSPGREADSEPATGRRSSDKAKAEAEAVRKAAEAAAQAAAKQP